MFYLHLNIRNQNIIKIFAQISRKLRYVRCSGEQKLFNYVMQLVCQ